MADRHAERSAHAPTELAEPGKRAVEKPAIRHPDERPQLETKSRPRRWIALVISGFAVIALMLVWWWMRQRPQDAAGQPPVPLEQGRQVPVVTPAATSAAGTKEVNPRDGLTYVWIPPGRFRMGCSPGDTECSERERPAHEVTITRGFWLGQASVTQQAYHRVTGRNPSAFKGSDHPVDSVDWIDAKAYCAAVGGRLPTEAEWEYAARAGSTRARYGELDEVAWYSANSGNKTHEGELKLANAFGLYDMLGNVWQWVADWYGDYQSGAQTDPSGAESGKYRTLRGGSLSDVPGTVRVSYRTWYRPDFGCNNFGFRCVRE
jgi:formylglycine-generating enzyme required for sulfatase activity